MFVRGNRLNAVYPKKYAYGFVVFCFVVVMQSFIINSHEVFIHIHQGCFAGTGAIVRLPQCQWSKPDGYGKISQCITTTKHSKAKTMCIFLGIYWTSNAAVDISCVKWRNHQALRMAYQVLRGWCIIITYVVISMSYAAVSYNILVMFYEKRFSKIQHHAPPQKAI